MTDLEHEMIYKIVKDKFLKDLKSHLNLKHNIWCNGKSISIKLCYDEEILASTMLELENGK